MAAKKRTKIMNPAEFDKILRLDWEPEVMDQAEWPSWLKGIPEEKVYAVLASGSNTNLPPERDGNVTAHGQIGGIDVYRYAEPTDGVAFNKDWYRVIRDPSDPQHLYVVGPIRDNEHYLDELPERLQHFAAKIARVPPET